MENLKNTTFEIGETEDNLVEKAYPHEEILVKKAYPHVLDLEIQDTGDWIDLRNAEVVILARGSFSLIDLGVCIKLPKNYELHLLPRSSTFKNYGLIMTNGMGIIDNSYCGDNDIIKMPVYATRDIVIPRNERIAQFRIVKNQPTLNIKYVTKMEDKDRGGFGSSNKQ